MAPVADKLGLSCFRSRSREIPSPTKHLHTKRSSAGGAPMLSASSSNNHSLFSFGRSGPDALSAPDAVESDLDSSNQYGFLPEVSFDDFQTSIESVSDDLKLTQFPSPTGEGSILGSQGFADSKMVERPNTFRNGAAARAPAQQGPPLEQQLPSARPRTGPVFRRPSASNRQTSISSTNSTMSRTSDTNRDPQATIRPKRQNQHPPISNSSFVSKQPRKSAGSGALDMADYGNGLGARRRPSQASSTDRTGADSSRTSIDSTIHYPDTSRNMTASRAAKIKTLSQPPPPRASQANASADSSVLSVDQSKASTAGPRSPRAGKSGASTPGSSRRMSVLPGHPSHHASGLGARTVSPTDAQRMKRRSFMPDPQNNEFQNNLMIFQPPPPPSDRPSSKSPSMLPRKTSTPVSQRTTPDPNRKSYSSGFSVGSTASNNTVRTSTGSLQPRPQPMAGSRLPAPKSMNNIPSPNEEDEDVPPVPAIPKVYESPKESPAESGFLDKRKSNLGLDTSSLRSTSTASLSGGPVQEKAKPVQRKRSTRKVGQNANVEPEKKPLPMQPVQSGQPKRNFKSMNLPPLTVGPLSTPTVNKIARLQHDQGQTDRKISSPPARPTKTPTTPMTASRSTFFPRRKELAHYRSTSSIHQARVVESPLLADTDSSESANGSAAKTSVSPYLSSSVPKENGFEQHYFKRSQTGNEVREADEAANGAAAQSKPSGPRAQRQPSKTLSKSPVKSDPKSPTQQSSPEEPQTPSSMSSLRRKLSLSWKRSSSKTEKHAENNNPTKHDAMPPPRLPVSATSSNSLSAKAASPSVQSKSSATQLDPTRRKPSSASLNSAVHHARNRSDASQGIQTQSATTRLARIDSGETPASRPSNSTSVMQKFLRSKASVAKIQQQQQQNEIFTADLDKDDMIAEEEIKKLGSRRKETELAAKTLDTLRRRATPKERVSPQDAIRIAMLNIYERGEIIDYKDIYFCGTQNAQKVIGDLNSKAPNFGYDDERGDYSIIIGDHLAYRYEIVDVLGKGSFGQVVRCIDHKTGVLVAVKIIRNKKRFHQQALVEVNILQKLREWVSIPDSEFLVDH